MNKVTFGRMVILSSVFSFIFSSCALINLVDDDTCYRDGRPPVICGQNRYIINYNRCFEDVYFDNPVTCESGKAPLTPDMFDPYAPLDSNYRLARGDILQLSIFGEAEADVENAMVAPDGKLYYSILNGIQAAGRRPEEVAKDLQEKLKNIYISPLVTITLKDSQALNYYILGRVRTAGAYPFKGPVTLREAIAEAGGLLSQSSKEQDYGRRYLIPYVDLDRSFICREDKKLDVDFERLLYEGQSDQNIYVLPEDYIYIAGSEKREVYILGALIAPQRLPFSPGMTLMASLATVQGWGTPSPRSPNLSRVLVIRSANECPRVCSVDIEKILCGQATDILIEPGDIIYASQKPFRFTRDLVLVALYAFANSFASAAAEYYTVFDWFRKIIIETPDGD